MSGGVSNVNSESGAGAAGEGSPQVFSSELVDCIRSTCNVWSLPGGELRLPRVFGFCGGVKRALAMLQDAVESGGRAGGRLILLGQVIHNPWVNEYFRRAGVRILTGAQRDELEKHVTLADCAIVPAFGVPLPIERRLNRIGCRIVDSSCVDVRRLWAWAEEAVRRGFAVFIYGRARHDETVVTKSRLDEAGGKYVVAGDLAEVRRFCDMVSGVGPAAGFRDVFGPQATNGDSAEQFHRLAQVSQTTMLYQETLQVRRLLAEAFSRRFAGENLDQRLLFQPSVCRATQDRQTAAVELCSCGLDLCLVVGGAGSSNTRHLRELAATYGPAYLIEDAEAVLSGGELRAFVGEATDPTVIRDWLPDRRPLRIGVLAGASSPEIVVGQVLRKLAGFLE
jgi:4-hydroxy-3-methylbut-2-enyl diphosphate reductase